jgi:hypothetical protein
MPRINNFEKGKLIREIEKTSIPTDKYTYEEHQMVKAEYKSELDKIAKKYGKDIAEFIKIEKVYEAAKEKVKNVDIKDLDKNHDLAEDELKIDSTHYIELDYQEKKEIKDRVIQRELNEQANFIKRLTLAETKEEADAIFKEYQALIASRTE